MISMHCSGRLPEGKLAQEESTGCSEETAPTAHTSAECRYELICLDMSRYVDNEVVDI